MKEWVGYWTIQYIGHDAEEFQRKAGLTIPNFFQDFETYEKLLIHKNGIKKRQMKNRIECNKPLRWYTADRDLETLATILLHGEERLKVDIFSDTDRKIEQQEYKRDQEGKIQRTFRAIENENEDLIGNQIYGGNESEQRRRFSINELGIVNQIQTKEQLLDYLKLVKYLMREGKEIDQVQDYLNEVLEKLENKKEFQKIGTLVTSEEDLQKLFVKIESQAPIVEEEGISTIIKGIPGHIRKDINMREQMKILMFAEIGSKEEAIRYMEQAGWLRENIEYENEKNEIVKN